MLHMRKTPLPYGKRGFHYSSDCGLKPRESLELDGGAGFFELGLGLLGVFLLGLLQDSLRSAVDESLGLSQGQVGDSADGLDDPGSSCRQRRRG